MNEPNLIGFALVALGLVLTPGPNMIYLVSRSICQGRAAGFVSLTGVATGFICYILAAALGLSAVLLVVPLAYDVLRFAGAIYLLYLAWQAIRPSGRSPFQIRDLPRDSNQRLFAMGFLTNLLNPKVAVLFVSLLPQFITPGHGAVLQQSLALGGLYVAISVTVNGALVMTAGSMARFLAGRPLWLAAQRWLMGTVMAALAVRLVADSRHS